MATVSAAMSGYAHRPPAAMSGRGTAPARSASCIVSAAGTAVRSSLDHLASLLLQLNHVNNKTSATLLGQRLTMQCCNHHSAACAAKIRVRTTSACIVLWQRCPMPVPQPPQRSMQKPVQRSRLTPAAQRRPSARPPAPAAAQTSP